MSQEAARRPRLVRREKTVLTRVSVGVRLKRLRSVSGEGLTTAENLGGGAVLMV